MAKSEQQPPIGWDDRLWVREGMSSFPLRILRFFLWLSLLSGVLAALLIPGFVIFAPNTATVELPVSIKIPFDDRKEQQVWGEGITITINEKQITALEPTEGKVRLLLSQVGPIQRFIAIAGSISLVLAWSFGSWIIINMLRTLPHPFTADNAKRFLRLGWLSIGLNLANYSLDQIIAYSIVRSTKDTGPSLAQDIATFEKSGPYSVLLGGHNLIPSISIPWSIVLSAFALAFVFRIGVQHSENERLLQAERELTV